MCCMEMPNKPENIIPLEDVQAAVRKGFVNQYVGLAGSGNFRQLEALGCPASQITAEMQRNWVRMVLHKDAEGDWMLCDECLVEFGNFSRHIKG